MLRLKWGVLAAVLFLLVMAGNARAAEGGAVATFKTAEGDLLVLIDAPCSTTKGIFAEAPPSEKAQFKAAALQWQGKNYDTCWVQKEDGTYFIVDEAGGYGEVGVKGSPFVRQDTPI